MSKNTKILLLEYLVVFICLIFLLHSGDSTIKNEDLFDFFGLLICLASIFLALLISIHNFLRKIAYSQTKTEEDWKLFINNQLNHDS